MTNKELLYIDYYFRNAFLKKFDRENEIMPDANERINFAHNARTICIAFVALASRYYQKNITAENLKVVFNTIRNNNVSDNAVYNAFSDIGDIACILPKNVFNDKDQYDSILDKLFTMIINAGIVNLSVACQYGATDTAANYLKSDKNYYSILQTNWFSLSEGIKSIFSPLM